jgi:hypothetical protein
MAETSTPKERDTRVPLDWYQRSDRLETWKRRLLVLALLGAIGWFGAGWLRPDRGMARYAPGPVTAVHATWQENCRACHLPYTPIGSGSWLASFVSSAQAGAVQCQGCHSGPIHHAKQLDNGQACASCHHEHRGRTAQLARVADSDCTHCHNDLQAHLQPQAQTEYRAATRFDSEHHPEFRLFRDDHPQPVDPRHLKFTHAVHMTAGMNCDFKFSDIDPAERKRYAGDAKAGSLVQLRCDSCHRLDARDPGSPRAQAWAPRSTGTSTARSPGHYMVPITYENECRACHPLTFDRRSESDPQAGLLAVPHGLQPAAVRDFVWGAYANEYVARQGKPQGIINRPLPGSGPALEADVRNAVNREVQALEKYLYRDRLSQAEKILFRGRQTCGECHSYESNAGQTVPARIMPTSVPEVWFQHARFDHAAHRAVACRDCHPQAYQAYADAAAPAASGTVMLPGRDVCLACHGPTSAGKDGPRGGARFDCVECHRFHNGDQPLQGIGAEARGIPDAERRTIQEFLSAPRP